MSIGVFTPVCDDDSCWIPQYLAEIERLKLKFAIHFDRCSDTTKNLFHGHPLCIGRSNQDDYNVSYDERHKQSALDLLVTHGFRWALHWDIDETWEKDAPDKLSVIDDEDCHCISVRWANLWNDPFHIRVDGSFAEDRVMYKREKFYRLDSEVKWRFKADIVYGPSPTGGFENTKIVEEYYDLVCLHWGYMTEELRDQHKARWDYNYGTARGEKNPYGTWEFITDKSITPEIVRHNYL